MFDYEISFLPPLELIAADFHALGLDIRSFREPLKRSVQQVVAPSIFENFVSEGRPQWEPLADSTVESKERAGYGNENILSRTGKLAKAATQLNAWTITSDDATMTQLSGVDYGEFHQDGTQFMPAREFAIIQDPDDVDGIERIFEEWLTERFIAKGLVPVGI